MARSLAAQAKYTGGSQCMQAILPWMAMRQCAKMGSACRYVDAVTQQQLHSLIEIGFTAFGMPAAVIIPNLIKIQQSRIRLCLQAPYRLAPVRV